MANQNKLTLTTRKQLDIFMNPQRQRLLKAMEIHGTPMTAKQLSDILKISASSVSLHINKLMSLGLIELDHTESIHGIQAKFYKKLPVSVSFGGDLNDDLNEERAALTDYIMSDIWNGFKKHIWKSEGEKRPEITGDFTSGIIYLKEEEVLEIYQKILDFANSHMEPDTDTVPWEYALVAYPHRQEDTGAEPL